MFVSVKNEMKPFLFLALFSQSLIRQPTREAVDKKLYPSIKRELLHYSGVCAVAVLQGRLTEAHKEHVNKQLFQKLLVGL